MNLGLYFNFIIILLYTICITFAEDKSFNAELTDCGNNFYQKPYSSEKHIYFSA